MKRCPKCTALMPDDALRCVRCGHESAGKPAAATFALLQPGAGRIRNGWALAKQSWRVLLLDKELLVFPLVSGIASLLVFASFVAVGWANSDVITAPDGNWSIRPHEAVFWPLCAAFYFINYFIIVFFNSALVACAMLRFRGGDPTVRDGLRAARERLLQIVAWVLLAATVGVVLRVIESRSKLAVRIITGLLGAAWTLATYFVVPVLVVEKLGPLDALKRSVAIGKKAWGESLVSNAAVGFIVTLVTFALVILVGAATVVLAVNSSSLAIALAGAAMVMALMLLGALVGSALGSIALSAIYLYATQGKVAAAFAAVSAPPAASPSR
jgi:Family of unknown function (DUF6159)